MKTQYSFTLTPDEKKALVRQAHKAEMSIKNYILALIKQDGSRLD